MTKLATLQFNPFGENTYILYDHTGECVIIDAGCYNAKEQQTLVEFIRKNELRPVLALNTHAHVDHICGVEFVKQTWDVPFALHEGETQILEMTPCYAESLGFIINDVPKVEINLAHTRRINFGESVLDVIDTPGHTPGGVSVHLPGEQLLVTGDTLFKESIGRTDLPGGDYPTLINSIIRAIIPLGADTRIFPGHGPASTISHEIMFNPFVSEVLQGQMKYMSYDEN